MLDSEKYLRAKHVVERLSISRSAWWQGVKDGRFPPGIKLSSRVIVWPGSVIEALIAGAPRDGASARRGGE